MGHLQKLDGSREQRAVGVNFTQPAGCAASRFGAQASVRILRYGIGLLWFIRVAAETVLNPFRLQTCDHGFGSPSTAAALPFAPIVKSRDGKSDAAVMHGNTADPSGTVRAKQERVAKFAVRRSRTIDVVVTKNVQPTGSLTPARAAAAHSRFKIASAASIPTLPTNPNSLARSAMPCPFVSRN